MPDSRPLLVVTPTLGRSSWLGEVVADVARLRRDHPVVHVLAVPKDRVAEMRAQWPDAVVVGDGGGSGVYGALNAGVAGVDDFEWLTYINDDDRILRLPPGLATGRLAAFDVVYGDVDYIGEAGGRIAMMPVCPYVGDIAFLLTREIAPFTQQGTWISQRLWKRLGGVQPQFQLAGDFDFWLRAAIAGAAFCYVSAHLASFRIHPRQLSADCCRARAEVQASLDAVSFSAPFWRRSLAWTRFRLHNTMRIAHRARRRGWMRSTGLFNAGKDA